MARVNPKSVVAHGLPVVLAAGLGISCGGDTRRDGSTTSTQRASSADGSIWSTQVALERGVHGTCRALRDDGRRWRCRLDQSGHPVVNITINDNGAWNGEWETTGEPPRTVTVDGEVGTTGDFTTRRTVFGCCVPLP